MLFPPSSSVWHIPVYKHRHLALKNIILGTVYPKNMPVSPNKTTITMLKLYHVTK